MLKNHKEKESHFRSWLLRMWWAHQDELDGLRMLPPTDYTLKIYFQKYKWWLKREYQFQNKQ
jgi:hypothetical protein